MEEKIEYEASLDHLHGKRLSRKKFKKFLMSEGKRRNAAEACCTMLQQKKIPYGDAKVQYILRGWPWFLSWLMSHS